MPRKTLRQENAELRALLAETIVENSILRDKLDADRRGTTARAASTPALGMREAAIEYCRVNNVRSVPADVLRAWAH